MMQSDNSHTEGGVSGTFKGFSIHAHTHTHNLQPPQLRPNKVDRENLLHMQVHVHDLDSLIGCSASIDF